MTRDALTAERVAAVARLNAAQTQRGPDDTGFYQDSHIALAMRRLSIIDLAGGRQPFYNRTRTQVLIANGEIYNAPALRAQLTERGHQFATGSDCETILHACAEWGLVEGVRRLRGMFAFALWDVPHRQLVLGRDRLGEKPLYWHATPHYFIFASELKALLATGLVKTELDPTAVDLYFHFQYVPEPRTPLCDVHKLDAAHLLVLNLDDWQPQTRCYWRMADAAPLNTAPVPTLQQALLEVSELIVRSDVPVGTALSGGLDSSAVTALATQTYGHNLHTFSVGYAGRPPSDERADAQALAAHLKLPWHEVEISAADVVASFPELNYWRDDPIADIAGYGYYAVMAAARAQGVPVMLQGQGGDELFWGYPLLRDAVRMSKQQTASSKQQAVGSGQQAAGSRQPTANIEPQQVASSKSRAAKSLLPMARRLLSSARRLLPAARRPPPAGQLFFYDLSPDFRAAAREMPNYYTKAWRARLNGYAPTDAWKFADGPPPRPDLTLTRLVCDTYLRVNGLAQGDRLSMAASVELRLPLVDYRLVETIIGLRKTQPDDGFAPKHWLREAVRPWLPEWVLTRPKRGFTPPVREWHNALFQRYGDSLRDGYLVQQNILTPAAGARLSRGPIAPDAITPLSFKALVLEQWCRRML